MGFVCLLTPLSFMGPRASYHTIIYHQFVRLRVREEPHWQGASIVKKKIDSTKGKEHVRNQSKSYKPQ